MAYNGFPFDDSLLKSLEACKQRIRINKASMIIIDGGVGEGKTTLAAHIAEYYQPGWIKDRAVELLTMGGVEFIKGLDTAVKKGDDVLVYDEAGDFSSRTSLTYFNQNINRIFETYRQTKKIIILCLPFFADIDQSVFKKSVPRMVIHCYGRTAKYGKYKAYSLWRSWYLRAKIKKLTVPMDCFNIVKPNLYGQFKDLDSQERKILADISIKGKKKIIKETYLNQKGLVSTDEIMKKTGYSICSIYGKLKNHKFEKVGVKKFYSKAVIQELIDNRGGWGRPNPQKKQPD